MNEPTFVISSLRCPRFILQARAQRGADHFVTNVPRPPKVRKKKKVSRGEMDMKHILDGIARTTQIVDLTTDRRDRKRNNGSRDTGRTRREGTGEEIRVKGGERGRRKRLSFMMAAGRARARGMAGITAVVRRLRE